MKLCRFDDDRLGLVEGDHLRDVTVALDVLPTCRYPLPRHDLLVAHLDAVKARVVEIAQGARVLAVDEVVLLSPVANPGKIVAAPVNYAKHLAEAREDTQIHHQNRIEEIQRVGLFLKANSALVGPGAGVKLAHADRRNDHEAELVVVIGRRGHRVPRAQALAHVAGYCAGLDMTTRGPEERSLRKSCDSYCVVGPWLVTADELTNPHALDFWLTVNGEPRQAANTRDLILDIAHLIEFASSFYTLEPGDLLFTGTPEGVGPVLPSDVIECAFEGIGRMRVNVR
jgi:2-keto-4-pentenoate hydratase/2-oxohepta-3-ene-1,7-dioic acid hydratase in catechol pathway